MKKVSLQQKRKTLNMEAEAYTQMDVFIFVPFFVFKANFKQMDIQSIRNSKSFPYTQLTSIAIYLILKEENFFLQIFVLHSPPVRPSTSPSIVVIASFTKNGTR